MFFPLPGQDQPRLPPPPESEVMSWYRTYLAMPDAERPPMRTYTVRANRAEQKSIDVDFVVHGDDGPASRWARAARPGDRVSILGPHGIYAVPDGTGWQLLIGDESALPAIGGIIEDLPDGARVQSFVEVAGPDEEQRFDTRGSAKLWWVHRGSRPHGGALLETVRAAEFPDGTAYAWVSGEADLVKHVRRHLVRERGIDKRAISFTGYWRQGRTEEEVGRENLRAYDSGAS
jgi:NADPH-dependent ferric siderophore reductase